ncbi:MinD/ParA family protein [Microbacteriaceae bacterium VKM Ac-2854]|nr:MinD/ParA family protein [Microbacteriaceae bacterium VKM Ac-2854]
MADERNDEPYERAPDTAPTRIPEGFAIDVELPAPRRSSPPADEQAVSIDDDAIDPAVLGAVTRSVPIQPIPAAEPAPMGPVSAGDPAGTGPYSIRRGASGFDAARVRESSRSDGPTSETVPGPTRRDRLRGEQSHSPESSSMLTPDRLLEVNRRTKPKPTGAWNTFLYQASFHGINLGDSKKVRAWKAMTERIQRPFDGGTRFVPIMTRKGGVGKTTVTALLGMALADAREDRIIAIDANPDRGTLSERVPKQTRSTVRDVVTRAASVTGFTDFSTMVSRDDTRLDVLASDTDPLLSEAFDEDDYNVVADIVERFYSIMLTDCGTGIVHSVMRATLQRADTVVIVSGGSVDEARLASETLTWLDANGYGELVRNSVVALNTATQGTNLVKLDEIESHFRSRVRDIVRIPYDPVLAAGSVVKFDRLKPVTKEAARLLAALVVEGMPVRRGA